MKRKGQAAMEFLMTYGWAILAAVIAIGVLAYIGVFSPSNLTSNMCTINAPFGCDEFAIGNDIQLNIRNGGGQSFTISEVNVTGCTIYNTPMTIADGGTSGAFTVTCGLTLEEKVKKNIKITYIKSSGGTINQTVTGSISGRVA